MAESESDREVIIEREIPFPPEKIWKVIVEPAPDPESRVSLSAVRRDALGMPRVRVDWRIGELVGRTVDRTLALYVNQTQKRRLASLGSLKG